MTIVHSCISKRRREISFVFADHSDFGRDIDDIYVHSANSLWQSCFFISPHDYVPYDCALYSYYIYGEMPLVCEPDIKICKMGNSNKVVQNKNSNPCLLLQISLQYVRCNHMSMKYNVCIKWIVWQRVSRIHIIYLFIYSLWHAKIWNIRRAI